MEPADVIALLIAFGVFFMLAGALGFAAGRVTREGSPWSFEVGPGPAFDDEEEEERTPYSDFADEEIDEEELPALKVDPNDPPTWKVYKGPGGPKCNCHDRPIQYGDNILMWPDPENPGAYRLFHEDFVEGMKSRG